VAMKMDVHAYPKDLAALVGEQWGDCPGLPDSATLGGLLSTCYQAGLMREEERAVTFRLVLAEPGSFPSEAGPPAGLHRLEFVTPRPFTKDELRRLSPASAFYRSLIGVGKKRGGGLEIWGLVNSGPRWVRSTQGGRGFAPPLPAVPVIHARGPGTVEVYRGDEPVANLEGGRLSAFSMDVFASRWLPEGFAPIRAELMELHREARRRAKKPWAPLDDNLTRLIGQHTVRRVISVLRDSRHGGTVIFIPPELTEEFSGENRYVTFKHAFAGGEPRRRFRTTIVGVMNRMAEIHGKGEEPSYPRAVGWEEYQRTNDERIAELDEAIFELAHLIAALASVDGAVVMSKRFEILGFGGEISGTLPAVRTVLWALDLEGMRTVQKSTDGVGTRHRSAYRLCNALPGVVAVVVSQDGNARFVRHTDGGVAYWDHS
jgi:hypothetical protein